MEGIFIEAGCALGGSTILIAQHKEQHREFRVYDVFGMIPEPSLDDPQEVHKRYREIRSGESRGIGNTEYYGYIEDLKNLVKKNLEDFGIDIEQNNIYLVKGLIQNTMVLDQNTKVAFAHIDVDWYEPVTISLERIFPKLSSGGSILIDDYSVWGGCRKAVDIFLETIPEQYELHEKHGALQIKSIVT